MPEPCKHPPDKHYAWLVRDALTGPKGSVTVVCRACKKTIKRAVTDGRGTGWRLR